MAAFNQMLNTQTVLLLYIVCGMICRRKHIITKDNQQQFINLVLLILMPCMVFNSFKDVTVNLLMQSLYMLLISLLICLLSLIIGNIVYRSYPNQKRNVMRYGTLINNAGFAGLPLAEETFGAQGLIFASIFLIPIRIFMWSAGISMFSQTRCNTKDICIKLVKNPCIIAIFLGIIRGLFEIAFPPFAETALARLSACVSPLSMIIIGAIIADVKLRSLFEKGVITFSMIRLFIIPLLTYSITSLLGFDYMMQGTAVILTSMPAATTTALLAAQHDANVQFASKLVFITTVASLLTAPLLMLLLI